jgi:kinesin family member 11
MASRGGGNNANGDGGDGDGGVHVNVILRCRPQSTQEKVDRAPQAVICNEALREVTLMQAPAASSAAAAAAGLGSSKALSRTFRFDRVFGPESTQQKLYDQAVAPIVGEVLEGFNCTIFAYGQTGTGKTYTMEGGPRHGGSGQAPGAGGGAGLLSAEAGVIPRAIKHVFDAIDANEVADSSVKVSFMEIYNEELTDLLDVVGGGVASGGSGGGNNTTTAGPGMLPPTSSAAGGLRLMEDRAGVVVQGLEEVVVKSAAEIYAVLDRGTAKRRTAETLLNKRSSRSHSVFSVTIHMKETTPEGEDVVKVGKLNLVDLAGSENISRSGARDGRAREAGSINQSLLTLGRVITALVEHSGHVPYRDSKLTRLLRDSLGGRTKTCIIATVAPSAACHEETASTLDYAHRAKNIRNR